MTTVNRFILFIFRLSHQEEMRSGTHFTQQNVFLPGWKVVMYPSSDILFMLRRDCFSPRRMSASCATSNNSCKRGLWFGWTFAVVCHLGGIKLCWMFLLLVSVSPCSWSEMLCWSQELFCVLFIWLFTSSICLISVLLILGLIVTCLLPCHLFHFNPHYCLVGPIVFCNQVCVIFLYFILYHNWLPCFCYYFRPRPPSGAFGWLPHHQARVVVLVYLPAFIFGFWWVFLVSVLADWCIIILFAFLSLLFLFS